MKLYVTPKGQWVGTQAEAPAACREEESPPGSWKAVDVPTDKKNLLLFLSKGWKPAEPEPVVPRVRVRNRPAPTGNQRWRAYFNGMFAGVLYSDGPEENALEQAKTLLQVRMAPDG